MFFGKKFRKALLASSALALVLALSPSFAQAAEHDFAYDPSVSAKADTKIVIDENTRATLGDVTTRTPWISSFTGRMTRADGEKLPFAGATLSTAQGYETRLVIKNPQTQKSLLIWTTPFQKTFFIPLEPKGDPTKEAMELFTPRDKLASREALSGLANGSIEKLMKVATSLSRTKAPVGHDASGLAVPVQAPDGRILQKRYLSRHLPLGGEDCLVVLALDPALKQISFSASGRAHIIPQTKMVQTPDGYDIPRDAKQKLARGGSSALTEPEINALSATLRAMVQEDALKATTLEALVEEAAKVGQPKPKEHIQPSGMLNIPADRIGKDGNLRELSPEERGVQKAPGLLDTVKGILTGHDPQPEPPIHSSTPTATKKPAL